MCGIYGYSGSQNAADVILNGLRRLDYRGYDSWGIAVSNKNSIHVTKKTGSVSHTSPSLPLSTQGIGHTRWATHGAVTVTNAHPHLATDESFTLAQNGIVENYQDLKEELIKKGYMFKSETDTEVIVRLIEEESKSQKTLLKSVRAAFLRLRGRNTIIVLTKTGDMIAARNGSPLVIGTKNNQQEVFFSSDVLSFAPYVDQVLVLENGQIISYIDNQLALATIKEDKKIPLSFEPVTIQNGRVDKEGYEHFMLKEIFDTPAVITTLAQQDGKLYKQFAAALHQADTVYTVGSGSAGIAAAQIAFYLRAYAGINTISLIGADAREYYKLFSANDIIIAPSQSGETADVMEVLEYARSRKMKIASYVNMPGSMMSRISDYAFMADAGPEICVMSTKVFTSQITWGYLLAKIAQGKQQEGIAYITKLSHAVNTYLHTESHHAAVRALAQVLLPKKDIFLLGKYQNYQIIREGMVKLIEGTYKHAHAIPAGDLKHYAITLMEAGVPVVALINHDAVYDDVISAMSQVKARGATVIGIGTNPPNVDFALTVPDTGETAAIMNIIPLQLLAYYLAKELGNSIDKPRNIAKSVTVK